MCKWTFLLLTMSAQKGKKRKKQRPNFLQESLTSSPVMQIQGFQLYFLYVYKSALIADRGLTQGLLKKSKLSFVPLSKALANAF